MTGTRTALRFARQDDYTLSLLARVQRETGYVPTMEELSQLLQCPTTSAARLCLDELVTAGEGTRLTPAEQQEAAKIAERLIGNEAPCMKRQQPVNHQCRHTHAASHTHVQWACPTHGE